MSFRKRVVRPNIGAAGLRKASDGFSATGDRDADGTAEQVLVDHSIITSECAEKWSTPFSDQRSGSSLPIVVDSGGTQDTGLQKDAVTSESSFASANSTSYSDSGATLPNEEVREERSSDQNALSGPAGSCKSLKKRSKFAPKLSSDRKQKCDMPAPADTLQSDVPDAGSERHTRDAGFPNPPPLPNAEPLPSKDSLSFSDNGRDVRSFAPSGKASPLGYAFTSVECQSKPSTSDGHPNRSFQCISKEETNGSLSESNVVTASQSSSKAPSDVAMAPDSVNALVTAGLILQGSAKADREESLSASVHAPIAGSKRLGKRTKVKPSVETRKGAVSEPCQSQCLPRSSTSSPCEVSLSEISTDILCTATLSTAHAALAHGRQGGVVAESTTDGSSAVAEVASDSLQGSVPVVGAMHLRGAAAPDRLPKRVRFESGDGQESDSSKSLGCHRENSDTVTQGRACFPSSSPSPEDRPDVARAGLRPGDIELADSVKAPTESIAEVNSPSVSANKSQTAAEGSEAKCTAPVPKPRDDAVSSQSEGEMSDSGFRVLKKKTFKPNVSAKRRKRLSSFSAFSEDEEDKLPAPVQNPAKKKRPAKKVSTGDGNEVPKEKKSKADKRKKSDKAACAGSDGDKARRSPTTDDVANSDGMPGKRAGVCTTEERDLSTLTMQDLIYYKHKSLKTVHLRYDPERQSQDEGTVVGVVGGGEPSPGPAAEKEESKDRLESKPPADALADAKERSEVMAPQVMINERGEIVLNEASLIVNQKVDNSELEKRPVVFENALSCTNHRKICRGRRWTLDETLRFYKALSQIGTDFSLMSQAFPKYSRRDLKQKFKREEKINCDLVDMALRSRLPLDMSIFLRASNGRSNGAWELDDLSQVDLEVHG